LGWFNNLYFNYTWKKEKMKINNKGYAGLVAGLVKLLGGMVFIYLLILLFSGGATFGVLGSKGIIMLAIFILVLWLITKRK